MSNKSILNIFPLDILKVITAFLSMIPLGCIFRLITNPNYRILTSFIWGNLIVILLYNWSSLHIYVCILINILILKFIDKKKIGKYALIYNMMHNSIINIYNQIYHYNQWKMDTIGVPFMMQILKHISFAYSYQDSAFENIDEVNDKKTNTDNSKKSNYYLYPENQVYVIKNFSFYEYINYILFYPCIVGGPFIEFNDFKKFIELRYEYKSIPSSLWLCIKKFAFGFSSLIIFYIINPYNKVENIIDYENQYTFFQKCIFYILGFFYVIRYFGGFSLIELGCLSCGFSYKKETYLIHKEIEKKAKGSIAELNSSDSNDNCKKNDHSNGKNNNNNKLGEANGNSKEKQIGINLNEMTDVEQSKNKHEEIIEFKKAKVIDYVNLLLIYDPDEFFRYWNIHVHHFLKRNIYLRNIASPEEQKADPNFAKKKKNKASLMTFLISAFWHGFYPTYFIVFLHFYLFTFIGNQIKSINSKINLTRIIPFYKNLIRFIIIVILIPYHCIIFVALDYKILIDLIKTTKCFATVFSLILLFALFVWNKSIKSEKNDEKKKNL